MDLFSPRLPVIETMMDRIDAAQNFQLVGDRKLARDWRGRAEDNVTAIRLLKQIESQNRPATPIEQSWLIRFVGFGASDLANGVFPVRGQPCRPGWEQIVADLTAATTPTEWSSLSRSTQYAHYTPEFMVRSLWAATKRLGFRGGSVIEPGCGTGLLFAMMPPELAVSSLLTGYEMDPITARIARLIHPRADIKEADFTGSELVLSEHDLAIGNPPFSDRVVRGAGGKSTGLSLHEFFVHRAVQALRPGGIGAFVVSRYLMDRKDSAARDVIGDLADLVGAVRLPRGAMQAAAGTDVVVDMLFFRRRGPDDDYTGYAWSRVRATKTAAGEDIEINRYWLHHPEMVLGEHVVAPSQWGPAYSCAAQSLTELPSRLATAVLQIGEDEVEQNPDVIHKAPAVVPDNRAPVPTPAVSVRVGKASDGSTIKEGSYFIAKEDDELYQIISSVPKLVQVRAGRGTDGMPANHAKIIRHLIPIRDAVRDVLRCQEADRPWEAAQQRLENAYEFFICRHGPINKTLRIVSENEDGDTVERSRRPNLSPMLDDPDCFLVSAIEEYDPETGTAKRGPIFTQRVISPPPEHVIHTAADALAVVLNECGEPDLMRVAELRGSTVDQVAAELGDAVYFNPKTQSWETDDAYLSGQVRLKLAEAQAAATQDAAYERNVRALIEVQPSPLTPVDISARLGAPWIPPADVMAFAVEIIGIAAAIDHTPEIAAWTVEQRRFVGQARATSDWGTARRHVGLLLEDALNNRVPTVYDYTTDDSGRTIAVVNAVETESAKDKLAKIKDAFTGWIWSDTDRSDRLCQDYNDQFNNLVPRRFSGSHLMLPGASTAISLRPHQKRVVWRIVSAGSSYIAHAVGAGKTYAIAAAIMEQKRLGLVSKTMLAVPGHCLAQFAREWAQLYPNARILVADETNFVKAKRSRFLARAATGTWDCIIITHSAFKFISVPSGFEKQILLDQLDNFETLYQRTDENNAVSRKRLERLKEGLMDRLKALRSQKDDMVTIAEIGIDQIIVDEAQEFRKLTFSTNLNNLRGIDPVGSQRAWDLSVKANFVRQEQPRRALILSSGTPITNTMGEMYTLLRFMTPDLLADRGVSEFDAWALTFGDTRTELELQPSGFYKPVTRFSQFVNVPELTCMFRSIADVVQMEDLREYVTLPRIETGQRQVITSPGSQAFKDYQKTLAARIKVIEARSGMPKKGDDIILSVITDGRHAAIDMRLVGHSANETENKLNRMIQQAFEIWERTTDAGGETGATQMIFSDLGTLEVEENRGFSAYRWIKEQLVALGVPENQIKFMQNYKASAAKQRLFDEMNRGAVRFLIGSSQTMGTGVNAQRRLKALHHLDVPWLPSQIEQREGRIQRQGNEHAEVSIYAYATLGSLDASMWQTNERKARFIAAVLSGDGSIRRMEDMEGSAQSQFAMAKAIASGDSRLMQKAGLEAEIARMERQRSAYYDDQYSVKNQVAYSRDVIAECKRRIPLIERDIAQAQDISGDAFLIEIEGRKITERAEAGNVLMSLLRRWSLTRKEGDARIGRFAGFDLHVTGEWFSDKHQVALVVPFASSQKELEVIEQLSARGLAMRFDGLIPDFAADLHYTTSRLRSAEDKLADYEPRMSTARWPYQAELDAKRQELDEIDKLLESQNSKLAVALRD